MQFQLLTVDCIKNQHSAVNDALDLKPVDKARTELCCWIVNLQFGVCMRMLYLSKAKFCVPIILMCLIFMLKQ